MGVPPRSVFADAARREVESHVEWDAPHCFQTLHLSDGGLTPRTMACIMTDIDPTDYPRLMAKMAAGQWERHPDDPAYAYLLQVESFGVTEPGPEASAAELAAYHAARLGRTFHLMPDAVECCIAWVADIHGRLWAATKTRKDPDTIHEVFYRPGKAPGGQLVTGLLKVAEAAGIMYHGMPGVPGVDAFGVRPPGLN
jgi:hypothetical protein